MARYLMLLKFTEKGLAEIANSTRRAAEFCEAAKGNGVTVETQVWTLGDYDGAVILSAPDQQAAAALAVGLGKEGFVRTTLLPALDAGQFDAVLAKAR